jgi:hypothetical protein
MKQPYPLRYSDSPYSADASGDSGRPGDPGGLRVPPLRPRAGPCGGCQGGGGSVSVTVS